MRKENELFKQDDLGNVQRELDPVRASVGSSAGGDDPAGYVTASADTYDAVYEIPMDAREFYLELVKVANATGADEDLVIHEGDRDGSGGFENVVQRSVTHTIGDGTSETIEYRGEAFTSDVVLVESADGVEVAVGGYLNTPEEYEPQSEETEIGSQ